MRDVNGSDGAMQGGAGKILDGKSEISHRTISDD